MTLGPPVMLLVRGQKDCWSGGLSPTPGWARRLDQPVWLKAKARQAVPWSEPSSRYFHVEPSRIRDVLATGVKNWKYAWLVPVRSAFCGLDSETRRAPFKPL